ncbi:MAG: collagen-binding domain-containing protein [Myxococcota bacterium]
MTPPSASRRGALLTLACVALACSSVDVVARLQGDQGADAGEGRVAFCEGAPLIFGEGAETRCLPRLPAQLFRYATCACEGIVATDLRTDSFDSTRGAFSAPGETGGAVGVNGRINAGGNWTIGGSLTASGDWTGAAELRVARDLRLDGRLVGPLVHVDRNADVNGDVQVDDLRIGGQLRVPAGATVNAPASDVGGTLEESVNVEPPCGCGGEERLNIAAFVASVRADNDNGDGLSPTALANVLSTETLRLECGRYYLDSVGATAPITLRIAGRVAIFVENDLAADALTIELEDGGELDFFIAGNIVSAGDLRIGRPESPASVRLYVGGAGTINLQSEARLAANLYAPDAQLVLAAETEVFGALFARRIDAESLRVHFDTSVSRTDSACPTPSRCDRCDQCPPVQGCVDGACAACRDDADCCAPLVCNDGTCEPDG